MKWITAVFILMTIGGFIVVTNQNIIGRWGAQEVSEAWTPKKVKNDIESHQRICIEIKALLKEEKRHDKRTAWIRKNIQQLLLQYEDQIKKAEKALAIKDLEQAKVALGQAEKTLGDLIVKLSLWKDPPQKESGDIKTAKNPRRNHSGDFFNARYCIFYFFILVYFSLW